MKRRRSYADSFNAAGAYPSVVIAVGDIREAMKKVTEAGGKVVDEPMEIPGYGLYVSFFDTEGNRVSVMQPTIM
jgi:predicted enzyme related to lactoylglutathione lyase